MTNRVHLLRYSAIGLLAAGVAFAQAAPPSEQYGAGQQQTGAPTGYSTGSAAKSPQMRFKDVATLLDLTPDQQTKGQQIFQNAWNSAQPLIQQFRQNRQNMKSLMQSGNVSQLNTQITPLAQKQGSIVSDLVQTRTRAMAQFYSLLTPDQRVKAAALHDLLTARFPFRLDITPAEPGAAAVPSE